MPIVKFISDKDCKIFIDKECVGEVINDSMLKLTLEPGEYLVEIKDADAHLLKKYKLEIKPTDGQILQNLNEDKSSIDDVIDQLKNDPSLEFHCNRAPFCLNGMYGYVDKQFEVVIPAIYTVANKFKDDRAFVVREFPEGKKTTLIDEEGNMFFNRWFDYIGESEETILFGIDDKIIVYSKVKYDKIAEYYNAGYNFVFPLVPVYKKVADNNFYGYIDFSGIETIPFIFNNVGNFDENREACVLFLGRKIKISHRGYYQYRGNNVYQLTSWNDKLEGLEGIFIDDQIPEPCTYCSGETCWNFKPIWNNYKWIIKVVIEKINSQIEIIEYNCDYVLRADVGYWICKKNGKILLIVANIDNSRIRDYSFDAENVKPVFEINESLNYDNGIILRTIIIENNSKYGVIDTGGTILIPVEYDEILPLKTYDFAVKKKNKYSVYTNGELTPFIYDEVSACDDIGTDNIYFLVKKNGKNGIIKWRGKIIPPLYDSIESCDDRNIVSLNGEYGIIDDEQRIVLPIRYEKIVPFGKFYFKVKSVKGWSLGLLCHGIIYPLAFDEINYVSEDEQWTDFFLVKKRSLYGCINNRGDIVVPIEYDMIELNSSFYNPRMFSFVLHKGDKVGFCDIYCDNFIFFVKPVYDNCVLLKNEKSVLKHYWMHYAAVQKNGKWGILDYKPRNDSYYVYESNLKTVDYSNLIDLEFKYDSLEELERDADNEFQRRYDKYSRL